MLKKLSLLIFAFFFCSAAHAQNTFAKVFDTLLIGSGVCVQQTFDGGYVVAGSSTYMNGEAAVMKLDSSGIIEWAKLYSGPGGEGAVYVEQTPDSGYIVGAFYDLNGAISGKSWLLRLNANGDTLWTQTYKAGGTGATTTYGMAATSNNYYGLAGYYRTVSPVYFDAFLIVADSIGSFQTAKVYNSFYGSEAHAVNNANQSGYILAGGIGTSSSTSDVYLIRTDTFGDTLWTRTYDNNSQTEVGNSVQQTSDSGFVVAGYFWNLAAFKTNAFLVKVNSNGDTIWTKQFINSKGCNVSAVHQTTDGGYIIVGVIEVPPTNLGNVYLIKADAYGDTLWTREFGGTNGDNGLFVNQTNDGGYIISGTTASFGNGGLYLIKTDSMGNVAAGTDVAEVNNPFVFSVYPNPSSGNFTIELKGMPAKSSVIQVYNTMQQMVYSASVKNYSPHQVQLSHLPVGIYIVVLHTNGHSFSQKIIIHPNH